MRTLEFIPEITSPIDLLEKEEAEIFRRAKKKSEVGSRLILTRAEEGARASALDWRMFVWIVLDRLYRGREPKQLH